MSQELLLEKISEEVSGTLEKISSSIVLVQGRRFPSSGIVWQKNLVLTTDHSLPPSEEIQVVTSNEEVVTCSVAGRDPSTDTAILRSSKELPAIAVTTQNKLKTGQLAVIAGRARGGRILGQLTMISGTSENYQNWRGGKFDQFIRLDTSAFPGFSGSALVLPDGKVAGMNTAVFSRHFGLTIPASNIERLVNRLATKGHFGKPYLGIMMQPVGLSAMFRQLSGAKAGLLILGAEETSPAEKAGVIAGDILVALNGKHLDSIQDIQQFLNEDAIGKTVNITIIRGGAIQELQITIGEREPRQRMK